MPVYERMQTQPVPVDVQLKQEYMHRRIDAVQQSGWCMLWSPYGSVAGVLAGSAAMGYVEKVSGMWAGGRKHCLRIGTYPSSRLVRNRWLRCLHRRDKLQRQQRDSQAVHLRHSHLDAPS